jgi:hypothetical protein
MTDVGNEKDVKATKSMLPKRVPLVGILIMHDLFMCTRERLFWNAAQRVVTSTTTVAIRFSVNPIMFLHCTQVIAQRANQHAATQRYICVKAPFLSIYIFALAHLLDVCQL